MTPVPAQTETSACYATLAGRVYRVTAIAVTDAEANAYLATRPQEAVLTIVNGRIMISHCFDLGIAVPTELAALRNPRRPAQVLPPAAPAPEPAPALAPESSFELRLEAFVKALNDRAAKLTAEGRRPLYHDFGYTLGPKHARIFVKCGTQRSSRAFFSRDGFIRRADSWKAAGRVLGTHESAEAFAYVAGL